MICMVEMKKKTQENVTLHYLERKYSKIDNLRFVDNHP